MLEVGQPGELPLMRELTALKKSRGLRDPTTTSSWKSPVLEANSSNAPVESLEGDEGGIRDDSKGEPTLGGNSRRDSGRGTVKRAPFRSPKSGEHDSRLSWDLGAGEAAFVEMETKGGNVSDLQQRENFRSHLEKLGVVGETKGWSRQSILHNWSTANCMADLDDMGSAIAAESTRQGEENATDNTQYRPTSVRNALRRDGSWPDSRDQDVFEHQAEPKRFAHLQDDAGRFKASQRTSRTMKGAQILSPLVLSSRDDIQKFSKSQSLFSLEEPYDEEEQYLEEEFQSGLDTVQRGVSALKVGLRSQFPPLSNDAHRSSRKLSNSTSKRSSQAFTSPVDDVTSWTRSLRPVPWEAEPMDYEEDESEMPRKESQNSYYRSKNQKQAKSQFAGQERKFSPDPRKVSRRKSGSVAENRSMLQQGLTSASHLSRSSGPSRSPGIEPLPLLTELEDYSGSDELAGSSVEGDGGRLSTSELHGELELEAYHTSDRHHAGRLVEVADKERLQLAVPKCRELALCEDRARNLSQKYRPRGFEEVVGQNIVTQALSNAILKGKIAPVYLFQGSRGTGKTSAARIFAAALVCISSEVQRPCGACRECIMVATGKCSEVKEVDAASNNGIERVKILLEESISTPSLSRYKVFIIDECHVLTTETWNALLRILEEPPMNVVFILITTDPDQLPRTVVSRCQKFPFPKIKDSEIVKRLQKLAGLENLEIDIETLQLIASRSDGSLRDAETTLDQLSLLGQKIDPTTVYELVGSASDERMLSLLDSALLADTVNTVRRARELIDSGVEPLSLMSRLATLITDILAGGYKFTDKERKGFFRKQNLSEEKLERLRMAMKTLSEAEKQLRVSNDRTTWLTAALLQLGPDRSYMLPASCAGTSVTQSPVALDDVGENEAVDTEQSAYRQTWDDDANFYQNTMSLTPDGAQQEPLRVAEQLQIGETPSIDIPDTLKNNTKEQLLSPRQIDDIWSKVIERCRPLPLRQLLYSHGKLLSISLSEVDAVVHLEFSHPEHKSRCERSQKSISNVFEAVLGFPVDVKICLASLPPEEQAGSSTWVSEQRSRTTQGSMKRSNGISSINSRIHLEDVASGGKPSNSWKNQGATTRKGVVNESTNTAQCFPAIPQGAFGSAPNENQFLETAASNMMPCADSGGRPGLRADAKTTMGEQQWFSPGSSSAGGDSRDAIELRSELIHQEGARRRQPMTLEDMQDLECDDLDDLSSEGQREIVGHILSEELEENTQQRHSSIEGRLDGQAYPADAPRTSDADLQKRKGSTMKMVRRLTMRSRIRSLPSSDQNSPDERGSSLRVPRFMMKSHTGSPKSKETKLQVETTASSEQVADSMEAGSIAAAPAKKSRLKGAAGSFVRLFQGKQTKQSSDATTSR